MQIHIYLYTDIYVCIYIYEYLCIYIYKYMGTCGSWMYMWACPEMPGTHDVPQRTTVLVTGTPSRVSRFRV